MNDVYRETYFLVYCNWHAFIEHYDLPVEMLSDVHVRSISYWYAFEWVRCLNSLLRQRTVAIANIQVTPKNPGFSLISLSDEWILIDTWYVFVLECNRWLDEHYQPWSPQFATYIHFQLDFVEEMFVLSSRTNVGCVCSGCGLVTASICMGVAVALQVLLFLFCHWMVDVKCFVACSLATGDLEERLLHGNVIKVCLLNAYSHVHAQWIHMELYGFIVHGMNPYNMESSFRTIFCMWCFQYGINTTFGYFWAISGDHSSSENLFQFAIAHRVEVLNYFNRTPMYPNIKSTYFPLCCIQWVAPIIANQMGFVHIAHQSPSLVRVC